MPQFHNTDTHFQSHHRCGGCSSPYPSSLGVSSGLTLDCTQESLRGPYGMLGIQLRPATCKGNSLPTVIALALQILSSFESWHFLQVNIFNPVCLLTILASHWQCLFRFSAQLFIFGVGRLSRSALDTPEPQQRFLANWIISPMITV